MWDFPMPAEILAALNVRRTRSSRLQVDFVPVQGNVQKPMIPATTHEWRLFNLIFLLSILLA